MVILVPPAFGPMEGSSEWTTGSWRGRAELGSVCRLMENEMDGGCWRPAYHIGEVLSRHALLGGVYSYHI